VTTAKTRTSATPTNPTIPADLWTRAERPEAALSVRELAHWSAVLRAALVRAGALVEASTAASVACPACDAHHVELVQWVRAPGFAPRAFVSCPENGPVPVELDLLRQWTVRPSALAALVANALGARGGVSEPVPGRIWKLGTVRAGGAPRAAFLALGATHPDAPAVFARVPELALPNALVLVPAVPPAQVWTERAPTVVPLSDALAVSATGLELVPGALEVFAAAVPMRKGPARTFPAPAGAMWDDVALTVEEHRLHVSTRDVSRTFGFAEAGFENRRKKNAPDALWVLLRVFARCRGTLAPRDLSPDDRLTTKPGALKAQVGKLRAALSALVGIEGDPFHRTRRGKPYRARFAVKVGGPVTCSLPAGATWDHLTLTATAAGVTVSVTADARGTAFAEGGTREGCTTSTEREFAYTFAEMGCTERTERALRAVLAGRGRVSRPTDDADMLELGAALTAFFGLSGKPFEYARGQWVATFEALPNPAER
jgi:hypothetical protein